MCGIMSYSSDDDILTRIWGKLSSANIAHEKIVEDVSLMQEWTNPEADVAEINWQEFYGSQFS